MFFMRYTKKILSAVLALTLIVALAIPAMAAEGTQITIDGNGSEFKAYKLFSLEMSLKDPSCHSDGSHEDSCYDFQYTVNDKYLKVLRDTVAVVDPTLAPKASRLTSYELLRYIYSITEDADAVRTFADELYKQMYKTVPEISEDYKAEDNTFPNVDKGYYLIVETKPDDYHDAISLVLLDTKGMDNLEIALKESTPALDKKVREHTEDGAGDFKEVVDVDVNDKVDFRLESTIPSDIDYYDTYMLEFHDILSKGFTIDEGSVEVSIDGHALTLTDHFTKNVAGATDDGHELTVKVTDVVDAAEKCGADLTAASKVVLTYTATLNENAVSSEDGNMNCAYLLYSNDPYWSEVHNPDAGEAPSTPDDPSKTPDDAVRVYTFHFDFSVIDGTVGAEDAALAGANFTLYKYNEDSLAADKWEEVEVFDNLGGTVSDFTFAGLGSGKYKLVESTVPKGYVKMDDVEFEVKAAYADTNDDSAEDKIDNITILSDEQEYDKDTVGGEWVITVNEGKFATTISNVEGAKLPSTGGPGAIMIYLVGMILIACAVAVIVFNQKKTRSHD